MKGLFRFLRRRHPPACKAGAEGEEVRLHERIIAMRHRRRRLPLRDRLRRRRRIVELALSKSVPTERLKAARTSMSAGDAGLKAKGK